MARTNKRLYGPAQLGNTTATRYTVPASTVATITRIRVQNPTGTDRTFTLSIGADAAGTRLYETHNVVANGGSVDIYGPFTLAATEIIAAHASAASALVMTINGYEDA